MNTYYDVNHPAEMNPQQEIQFLEQFIDQMISTIHDVLQSGEELSDEFQGQLAEVLGDAMNRLDELQTQEPVEGLPPNAPPLEPGSFPSSNINSFKYDPENQQLFVKFHGSQSAESGPTYGYENVPAYIYDVFRRGAVGPKTSGRNKYHTWIKGVTPSLGASMNALIKAGGYNYTRLSA